MSSKSGPKSIRKFTSEKGVPGRSAGFRPEPSWGPEGPIIKEVWLLRRSGYSRIRMFGDLVIQIFGIVFGGAAVRKGVLCPSGSADDK